MIVMVGSAPAGSEPALEVAIAHALVRRVSRAEVGSVVRLHRPSAPTVAFGRSDVRRPGFAGAARAARGHGFEPVVRAPGGHAVAYTPESLVIDLARRHQRPYEEMLARFVDFGELMAGVLRHLGVDARVGEVPAEYCRGEYSVNARGVAKLVGTAQRVVRDAWLLSAVVQVADATDVREVLRDVYGCLELPFAAGSVGSVRDEVADIGLDRVEGTVREAFAAAMGNERPSGELQPIDSETLSLARELLPDHVAGDRLR